MEKITKDNRNLLMRNLPALIVGAIAGGVVVDLIHRFTGLFS